MSFGFSKVLVTEDDVHALMNRVVQIRNWYVMVAIICRHCGQIAEYEYGKEYVDLREKPLRYWPKRRSVYDVKYHLADVFHLIRDKYGVRLRIRLIGSTRYSWMTQVSLLLTGREW